MNGRNTFWTLMTAVFNASVLFSQNAAMGQCVSNGTDTQFGLGGVDTNPHPFPNRCLAADGTNVTITIEGMADLGCNAWDAVHPPFPNQCASCSPIPCCDTDPVSKYLTVTGNFNAMNPAISGSTNMPSEGKFFKDWAGDCGGFSQTCLEAGRSPCDGGEPFIANKRVTTIPGPCSVTVLVLGSSVLLPKGTR